MRRLRNLAMVAVMAIGAALHAEPCLAMDDAAACGAETARQEKLQAIPDRLLHAISLVESGRWDPNRRASFAWPWTVTAEGEGHFLPTKAAAIAEVRRLQARGVRNIDVGCMQVNLLAHPDAFGSLEQAFDPASNVAYAGRFLVGLYESTQNWPTAAAYYHSQTPSLAAEYKAKLLPTWDQARRRTDDRLQLASLDTNQPPVGLFAPPVAREMGMRRAASAPVPPIPDMDGRATARRVAAKQAEAKERLAGERAEAKQIADAYRQARLEEYRLRKAQMAGG